MSAPRLLDTHPVFAPGILRGFHLLESDAGTGKTWTIAGLVVRALVELELDIDRILVVTFTNAATAELAARIRERIGLMAALLEAHLAGADTGDGELFCREYLPRIADREAALRRLRIAHARVDEAAVRTIHGYCQRVIAEHGLSIGLAGGIEVGEGDGGWIDAMVDDWWRRQVIGADAAQLALLAESGVDPQALGKRVRAIHENPGAARAEPGEDWRELAAAIAALRARLAEVLPAQGQALLDWISVKGRVNGKMIRRDWATGWLAKLSDWAAQPAGMRMTRRDRQDFAKLAGRLTRERFEEAVGEKPMPPDEIPALCTALARLHDRCDGVVAQLAESVWRDGEPRRRARRSGGGRLAFDDLLAIVHEALQAPGSGTRLARQLRERHPLALIDECQDTDAQQWEIFRRIHLEPGIDGGREASGLVLVGDPKQAIYAFRGADVYSYLDARRAGPAAHALRENQRSVPGLVDAVNALFDKGDAFGVPGIAFERAGVGGKARRVLTAAAGDAAPRAPLTVFRFAAAADADANADADADADGSGSGSAPYAERASALAVSITVAEIRRLLGAGLRLDGVPVEPSDIAVLVDSHVQGSLVKRALGAVGVGAVEISRERVVASAQAEELSRWLAAAAEPADAGLLRAALLAAPAGLDAAALESLAADPAGWNAWVEHFSACREDWARHGPQAALRRLLFATGAAARLAALRDGERRLTNLLHLFELIAASDEASQGPRQAWRWLARTRAADGQAGEAFELRLDSDENLVRILTVHKSKGLEFPFVFLPFAWQGRRAKADPPFVHHFGPGSLSGDSEHWQPVLELSDRPGAGAQSQRVLEVEAESVRRLYVALTRAEQRCHVLWGPADAAASAPLAGRLAALAGLPAGSEDATDPAALARAADAWAAAAKPGSVAVVEAGDDTPARRGRPSAGATAPADARPAAAPPQARPFAARIPAPWVRTSFSALAQRIAGADGGAESWGGQDDARPDHDQVDGGAGSAGGEAEPATTAPGGETSGGPADAFAPGAASAAGDMRFAFPAGARAGSCLHGILEHCAFDAPLDRRLVAALLARAGFAGAPATGVAGWLDSVLDTGLRAPDGRSVSLRKVAPSAVREMDFLLPGEGVDDRALLEAVASEYPIDAQVASSRWSGFLRGFIDLVFEQDGRWYVLDWKSNRLGGRLADYGQPAIEAAMREHAYPVQVCLYLLVLHRLLRLRRPGYDWDRDIGGAFWVFLRGVRTGPAGEPTPGVHASKPSRALIERLDALFDGGRR